MSFDFKEELTLDYSLRKELAKPYGMVVRTDKLARLLGGRQRIYAIGDVTVKTLLDMGIAPRVAIFDYRTERVRSYFPIIRKKYPKPLTARNRAGTVGRSMWDVVRKCVLSNKFSGIRIFGEEDLASLPCIHFARNGDYVLYGIRGRGVAVIKVDKKVKQYVERVLNRMSI